MKGSIYFIMLGIIISGCAKHQVPITKREQLNLLSKSEELNIGNKTYQRIMSKASLCKDDKLKQRINRISKKLIKAVKASHIKNWEIVLLEKKSVNAACLPNGKIFINRGVFKVAKNDDQLAMIIAHEMSHALARHGGAKITRNKIVNSVGLAGGLITTVINPFLLLPYAISYSESTKHYIKNPASKLEEQEADQIALVLIKNAGFDIYESIKLWENMKKYNPKKGIKDSHSHFSYDKRIKDLKKYIKKLESS